MSDMNRIRISKVENVTLWRQGLRVEGSLHLTQHHLIFRYIRPTQDGEPIDPSKEPAYTESWFTYPMISFCTYRPPHPGSRQAPTIRFRFRDFVFIALHFVEEKAARDVYDSIKSLTCRRGKVEKLPAFTYQPSKGSPEEKLNGWAFYDPRKEFKRMGISAKDTDKGWRISTINSDYKYSPTYPSVLVVPSSISDNVLRYAGNYRSRSRIPVLTYRHDLNNCSITRSSQPLAGIGGNRNVQDEKLVASIFATSEAMNPKGSLGTSRKASPERSQSQEPPTEGLAEPVDSQSNDPANDAVVHDAGEGSSSQIEKKLETVTMNDPPSEASTSQDTIPEGADNLLRTGKNNMGESTKSSDYSSYVKADAIEDEIPANAEQPNVEGVVRIYGAQRSNFIVDARPTINAVAMSMVGKGSENMEHYKNCTKAYLGIANIHVMRKSLHRVVEALKDYDMTSLPPNHELLAKSGWLNHIRTLLQGTDLIVRQIAVNHSNVLIHCSDGWDRTSQLSALSQLCLDPYYRTIEGFVVLVEKDWLSFGHMFRQRAGLLGSDKWFEVENDRVGGVAGNSNNGHGQPGVAGANAFENALLSAKGFFNRKNESRESLASSDGDALNLDNSPSPSRTSGLPKPLIEEKRETKVNEVSPVFHQFLDVAYQLLRQFPTRFEFNEYFLRRLLYHLYACQYGTFLFDSERERVENRAAERTRSVWDHFLALKDTKFKNKNYDPESDDMIPGKERVLFPKTDDIKWWAEAFRRKDQDMTEAGVGLFPINKSEEDENVLMDFEQAVTYREFGQRRGTPGV